MGKSTRNRTLKIRVKKLHPVHHKKSVGNKKVKVTRKKRGGVRRSGRNRGKNKKAETPAPETVAEPQTPPEPQTPVAEPQTPVAEPQTPVAEPQTPVAEPQTPVAEPQTPPEPKTPPEPQTPVAEPQTPVPEPLALPPLALPPAPVPEPQTPVALPQTPVALPPAPEAAPEPVSATGPGYFKQMTKQEFDKLSPKEQEEIEKERALKYEEHKKLSEYRVFCIELEKQHHEALRQLAMANQRVRDLNEELSIMRSRERTLLEQLARCPDPKL